MNIWVMQGVHEGELFASTHLTEKGAAIAAIQELLMFLGVEDEETALSVMNSRYAYSDTDGEQTEPFEWDQIKLRDMGRDELWKIFGQWGELTWDNDCGYQIDVNKTEITA